LIFLLANQQNHCIRNLLTRVTIQELNSLNIDDADTIDKLLLEDRRLYVNQICPSVS
jgi:hypothetical protein